MREAISEGHHSQDRPPRVLSKGDDSEMLVDAPLDGTQAIMLLIKHLMREAIRCHNQRSSEAIRGHQRSSEAIRGHQRSSEAIRGHQRSSATDKPKTSHQVAIWVHLARVAQVEHLMREAIRGHHAPDWARTSRAWFRSSWSSEVRPHGMAASQSR